MRNWLVSLLVCAFASASAHALAPTSVTIQGRLTDAANNPMSNATVTMSFVLYDAQVAGNSLWSGESQVISTDTAGLWTARVGALIPLNQDLFGDTSRWLEIAVDDGNAVTTLPRVRLVTSPFAFRVGSVDGAYGGTILSKVSIGPGHQNSGANGFVAGESNSSLGDHSTIDGGMSNLILNNASVIGGGVANTTQGDSVTIGGGAHNTVNGVGSTIGGGTRNATTGIHNVVAGGTLNNAFLPTDGYAVIGGGTGNIIAAAPAGVIGGGSNNRVNAALGTIAGGSADTVNGASATVGGGYNNVASGDYSTIAGGTSNDAIASTSTVGGGSSNTASGFRSTVSGGYSNSATESGTTVSGGESNTASGVHASVAGGYRNRASGSYSFAVGDRDSALANYSTAMGQTATARHANSFVWGDGTIFLSTDTTDQFKVWASNGVRFAATGGESRKVRIGDRFRDNGILAWGEVNSNGTIEDDFGIASVLRLFTGNYRVTIDIYPGAPPSVLVPVVSVDPSVAPNSAANARLAYVTNVTASTFDVVITTGAYVDVDEKFRVIVTAR